ncbi:hypothetical protein DKM44_11840 [Deinococcus irradiatisoli]|uniref:Uncharacterized protein n=1 Tax=Deinococcus irradiatisoli TaxID=2202254 RepID=A0A2Z3JF97_9DEIO|nr:hypothetical protein [Deinococcus irradiatisoli]AWN23833.1 hypothetical protein DKM44_11840 [Deinococcus irradiatisoli]
MTDQLKNGYSGETDTTPGATIEESMQGATGEMDANGLAPDFDADKKLSELKANLDTPEDPDPS